jgi:3-oxoacyl-[acyl-carrier-protein] synthase-1
MFDAMGALSTSYPNSTASRPYDMNRDGFVIAGGAGILVLESYEHALERGAKIYAEITGFGVSSDGADMVLPSADGAARAMQSALSQHRATRATGVDYINAHATSTPIGDVSEIKAISDVFGQQIPLISSTKGQTGHPIAASGVHEAIYSMLMLKSGFLAGCSHLNQLDPALIGMPILTHTVEQSVDTILSNSFGFGGTNVSLIFSRCSN